MLDSPDPGTTVPADTFSTAYQHLVEDLERALWLDESGAVVDAYQAYTDACEQALADPQVQQRVTSALADLTAALGRALERSDARALVEDAAASYVREVGAAWPDLHPREDGVEALLAVATGMTTLAWLFGLGSTGLVTPFGLAGGGLGGWGATSNGSSPSFAEEFAPAEPDPVEDGDDDGILWQEFDVGDDGEIVQKQAAPNDRPAAAPRAAPAGAQPAAGGDPVDRVRRAFADYENGLKALGIPVALAHEPDPAPEIDRRGAELAGSYLRLLHGSGTVPDVYAHYARLLESATQLLERQVALARGYEQLMQAALQGRRPEQLRRAADDGYQRLVATIRDAWSEIDPARVSPEQLADLAETTARAAKLHEATTGTTPA